MPYKGPRASPAVDRDHIRMAWLDIYTYVCSIPRHQGLAHSLRKMRKNEKDLCKMCADPLYCRALTHIMLRRPHRTVAFSSNSIFLWMFILLINCKMISLEEKKFVQVTSTIRYFVCSALVPKILIKMSIIYTGRYQRTYVFTSLFNSKTYKKYFCQKEKLQNRVQTFTLSSLFSCFLV
jgi:hypothetical protein